MNHGLKLHPDGTLEITMPKDKEVTRVLVCQAGTQNGKLYYPEINRDTKVIAEIKISKEDIQSAVDEAVEKIRAEMEVPEIIRCKDCRNYEPCCGHCKHWERISTESILVSENDFCSQAERRTDE